MTNDRLFFVAKDPENPDSEAIWLLDVNADAPRRLDNESLTRRWGGLTAFGEELMFREINSNGFFRGFYLTDGTVEGTRRLNPSPLSRTHSAFPVTTLSFDGFLFDKVGGGGTLIRIDPSRNVDEQITSNVQSFRQSGDLLFVAFEDGRLGILEEGSTSITTIADFSSANITKLVPHETGVFVETWSTDASPVVSIWSSDGTSSGTSKLLESNEFSSIKELHPAANSLFFVGSHRQLGNRLWAVSLPVMGDVNDDMIANQDDIDAIFAAVRDGSDDDRFDLNEDDAVTGEDATYLIETVFETRQGDLDLNGRVEFADFLRLGESFGNVNASWAEGDLDGDATVEFEDFLTLAANFGFRRPQ